MMAAVMLLLLAALGLRPWLETSMATHMLLQLPAIAVAGWLLGKRLGTRLLWCDVQGLSSLAIVMLVSAYWMVPRVLEASVGGALAETAKFASVLLAGMLLRSGMARANCIVQIFFLGNWCAMTAIAGMLYQEQPRQLCKFYTVADLVIAGIGLVSLACAAALAWCVQHHRVLLDIEPDCYSSAAAGPKNSK